MYKMTCVYLSAILLFLILSSQSGTASSLSERGALSYVVNQGCAYLTHYLRDNYFPYMPAQYTTVAPSTTTAAHFNWVSYVYDRCVDNYIPMELMHALINCGKEYALYGVKADQHVVDSLKVDYSIIPGVGR